MLSNLTGWHALIILGALSTMVLVALAIVFLAIRVARRRQVGDHADRLAQLEQLHARGLLSDAEYATKRQDILGRL
ncbi:MULTISPECIES: SHOCT domain-containing protein [unclassified Cryobacterium]|uniref:SHOCT domain-containing protein n=1 Tax=unclassified Cryobacterium TaxID=2649013 RepID=UPI00106C116F|nr:MULTISPECIES: SHOCT domain-containing protein [unclassified Cryobacterium]TFC54000.1 SHOCT domain-containing protein [Cryobacterium sp. TMB3-1-2]TFC60071.1 SHOCT domain-containing protein [Cryobacterium sp. TMB1-7]TFC73712.1 SHOCT domain-containing protein [Cryobacterium sp. TMB3-15]TFC77756.1 SHOCT domain-containing protein [Cryobacterium sp. TMB3-10]TFC91650.1 SHOCT domain-containing protein [Cryobacterium sp. TMT4-31]